MMQFNHFLHSKVISMKSHPIDSMLIESKKGFEHCHFGLVYQLFPLTFHRWQLCNAIAIAPTTSFIQI
jgi:hypothetical protein